MTMDRQHIVSGLVDELQRYRDLVAGMTDAEAALPTRCTGWTAFDLAAHVTGVTVDIVDGRLDGIDTQPWYDRQVAERRGRSLAAIVDEFDAVIPRMRDLLATFDDAAWAAPAVPGVDGTLGRAIHALWCGAYIHAEDVACALRRPPVQGPGLPAAVAYIVDVLTDRGWGPAVLDLTDVGEISIGRGGRRIQTDALTFVLTASGRADASALGLDTSVHIYG